MSNVPNLIRNKKNDENKIKKKIIIFLLLDFHS